MKFKLITYVLLVLCSNLCNAAKTFCTPESTFGSSVNVAVQIYELLVTFDWKDSKDAFCLAHREQQGPNFITKYVPRNQTLDNWTEMLSIVGKYRVSTSNKDFLAMIKALGPCESEAIKIIKNTTEKLEVVKVCSALESKTTHILLRRANNNTYIFYHTKRGAALDASTYDFNNKDIKTWSQFLNGIKLIAPPKQ